MIAEGKFYDWIMNKTEGKRVDIALNSLSDEMLQLSLNVLKIWTFCEIGKYDIIQTKINMAILIIIYQFMV